MDIVSPATRSAMMARIRAKGTRPEVLVRQAAHGLGYRFRLHRKDLPGTPDLVFPGRRTALFVHGCFWHRHPGCKYSYTPKSNVEFWGRKLEGNIKRDQHVQLSLERIGWRVAVIWECEASEPDGLRRKLKACLDP